MNNFIKAVQIYRVIQEEEKKKKKTFTFIFIFLKPFVISSPIIHQQPIYNPDNFRCVNENNFWMRGKKSILEMCWD